MGAALRWAGLLVVIAVLAVAGVLIGRGPDTAPPPPAPTGLTMVVPRVLGLTEKAARDQLTQLGLGADVTPAPGTKLCIQATPPVVGRQDPEPQTVVPDGATVHLALRWVLCDR